jgi:hypothetical protein
MGCSGSTTSKSSAVAPAVELAQESATVQKAQGAAQFVDTSVAGEALLAVGQHLPWIAPVAFLIGAVIKAAHDVAVLKGDALKFANFVRTAEAVLNEAALAGTLAAAEDAVAQARSALEATLAHLQKLSVQSKMAAMLIASRDKDKFAELQAELQRCMDLVALAASVSTNNMVAAQFEQGKRLEEKLAAMGGLDAVGSDAVKLAAVEKEMATSDQLMMRGVNAVREEVAASAKHVEDALTDQFARSDASADLRHEVMTKQIDNLTTMVEAMLKLKAAAATSPEAKEPGTGATGGGDSSGAADQAFAEVATAEAVHEAMAAMPVMGDEAARLAKVRELGLDYSTDKQSLQEMVGDVSLEELVDEAREGMDIPVAWVAGMDRDYQTFLAAATPAASVVTSAA